MAKRKKVSQKEKQRREDQSKGAYGLSYLADGKGGVIVATKHKKGWLLS